MEIKKYMIAYLVLHIAGQFCPLKAAAAYHPSLLAETLSDCDDLAQSIAGRIPQYGPLIEKVAQIMHEGKEALLNPRRYQSSAINFNSGDASLDKDFYNLQSKIETIDSLLQTITPEQKQQDRVLYQINPPDKRANGPWKPLQKIYAKELMRERDYPRQPATSMFD